MQPRVSLCLIVKNEEADLPVCLASAADLVDEIIVVDTGSTDRTREAAAALGARVFDFRWRDDFAAARNESLRHAKGTWIFWLDADEHLDPDNRRRIRTLLAGVNDEVVGYLMKQWSLPNAATGTTVAVDQARLFPNHPQIRWRYRAHEQILPALEELGGSVRPTDVVIQHTGYQDPVLRRRKNERNLRLLQLDKAEHPDDPIILFHLGWALVDLGRPAEAVPELHQALARSWPGLSCVGKTYALLVNALHTLGQKQEALSTCTAGRRYFPDDPELLFLEGVLRTQLGDPADAEACLVRYLQGEAGKRRELPEAADGICQARHHLAEMYREQGRAGEAEAHWRAVVAERPDHTHAWMGLVELWRMQGRLAELPQAEEVARRLQCVPRQAAEARLLQALVFRARKEFAAALSLLEEIIAAAPEALEPRLTLSFVLLDEGRDWGAFEQALRAILRLDPHHAQTRHNLNVLLQRQGRSPEQG